MATGDLFMARRRAGASGTSSLADYREANAGADIFTAPPTDGDKFNMPVQDVAPCPFNPREGAPDTSDIIDSIRDRGLLQPVTVVTRDAFIKYFPTYADSIGEAAYVLAYGHRRLAACVEAELPQIPVILNDALAPELEEILLIENMQRQDLTPLEEARAFRRLATRGDSYGQIATKLRCAKSHVAKRLSLLKLPPELQEGIRTGALGVEDARILGLLKEGDLQVAAWQLMQAEDLTVTAASNRVRGSGNVPVKEPGAGDLEDETKQDVRAGSSGESGPRPRARADRPGRKIPSPTAADDDLADSSDDQARGIAAAQRREQACVALLGDRRFAEAAEITRRLSLAVVTPHHHAEATQLALGWLNASGHVDAELGVRYFSALSSDTDSRALTRAAFAVALAQDELRLRDPQRTTWDERDAAHIEVLVRSAGYEPSEWETDRISTADSVSGGNAR
jgi:ParB/RepB/Spo0J family partition protein